MSNVVPGDQLMAEARALATRLAERAPLAMALTKELTEHSLPEIGDAFAGRDHTTVLHACRQIRGLLETDGKLREDWDKLIRKLSE